MLIAAVVISLQKTGSASVRNLTNSLLEIGWKGMDNSA